MTLQPIPSEFPYIWGTFYFLFYQCSGSRTIWHNFIMILTFSTAIFMFSCHTFSLNTSFSSSALKMHDKYFIIFWAHWWHWVQHSCLQVNNLGKFSLYVWTLKSHLWRQNSLFCGNAKIRLCTRFFSPISLYFLKCSVQNQMDILWVRQVPAIPMIVTYCRPKYHAPPSPPPPIIYTENVLSQKQHIYSL